MDLTSRKFWAGGAIAAVIFFGPFSTQAQTLFSIDASGRAGTDGAAGSSYGGSSGGYGSNGSDGGNAGSSTAGENGGNINIEVQSGGSQAGGSQAGSSQADDSKRGVIVIRGNAAVTSAQ